MIWWKRIECLEKIFVSILSSIRLVTTPFTIASTDVYFHKKTWRLWQEDHICPVMSKAVHMPFHPCTPTHQFLSFLHRWTYFSLRTLTLAILNCYAASQLFTQNINKTNHWNIWHTSCIIWHTYYTHIHVHIHICIYVHTQIFIWLEEMAEKIVESTCCSCRGLVFSSQHLHELSQLSVTRVPRVLMTSFGIYVHQPFMWCIYIQLDKSFIHIK